MKKKIWICIAGVVLLAILFVPIPSGTYKDGGTRAYSALTYKIVKWQRDTGSDVYKATRVYWLPNNFKSIDSLWAGEDLRLTFLQGPHSSSIPSSPKMLCSSRLARYSRLSTCLLFLPMTRAASA